MLLESLAGPVSAFGVAFVAYMSLKNLKKKRKLRRDWEENQKKAKVLVVVVHELNAMIKELEYEMKKLSDEYEITGPAMSKELRKKVTDQYMKMKDKVEELEWDREKTLDEIERLNYKHPILMEEDGELI